MSRIGYGLDLPRTTCSIILSVVLSICPSTHSSQSEEYKPEGERPPLSRLYFDSGTAILAAADTTASIMSGVFYYLLANPKMLEQARAEVDANFGSEEVVTDHTKLAEMPFLNACMSVFCSSIWSH